MTTSERDALKYLGVKSLGVYTSETGKTIVAVHLEPKKVDWEKKAVEEYLSSILSNATFLV